MGKKETADAVRRRLDPLLLEMERTGLRYRSCSSREEGAADADPLRPSVWVDEHDLCKAVVRRTPHATEGGVQACVVDVYMLNHDQTRDKLRAWLSELAPVMAHDRIIEEENGDPIFAEPRFYSAHPVTAAAARAYGWTMEDVARPLEMGRIQSMPSAYDEDGLYTAMLTHEGPGARVTMSRRLLRRRVVVEMLDVNPNGGSTTRNPLVSFSEDAGFPVIAIQHANLPDSILASLAGRTVGEVLSGPDWAPFADQRIETATTGMGPGAKPWTHLRIADGQVMLDGLA